MRTEESRLHPGEIVALAGALVLLVLLFAAKWYGPGDLAAGHVLTGTVNGWNGLLHLRWLIVVTICATGALGVLALVRRGGALRLALRVIVALLGLGTVLWLGYRVLISIPPGQTAAAYFGLASAVAIFLGACFSLIPRR